MSIVVYIIIMVGAYLLGSIPTGYLVGRARGVDIRTVGSGNTGATNVLRVLGKPAGAFVLAVDALKGYAACAWFCSLVLLALPMPMEQIQLLRILAGICAILGHNYTCWLGFKGGKGVATSAGVFLALSPLATGGALATWIILFALTRYVSIASMGAALTLVVCVWMISDSWLLRLVTTALGLLVIIKHRSNIQRLVNGTESRFGNKRPVQEVAK